MRHLNKHLLPTTTPTHYYCNSTTATAKGSYSPETKAPSWTKSTLLMSDEPKGGLLFFFFRVVVAEEASTKNAHRRMFGHYSRRRPQRGALSPAVMLLLMQVGQRYEELPIKPPVTFGLVAVLIATHLGFLVPYPLEAVYLSSSLILRASSMEEVLRRAVYSALVHADDVHLYYNVVSLLVKGAMLEQRLGSELFCFFLVYAVVAASAIYVIVGELFADVFGDRCAVGFSGVLFAMKVVLDENNNNNNAWGIRQAAWAEVFLASYLNPRSSLLGHGAGIIAGALWRHVLSATRSRRTPHPTNNPQYHRRGTTRYTYAYGTTHPPEGATPSQRQGAPASGSGPQHHQRSATAADLRRRRVDRFTTDI